MDALHITLLIIGILAGIVGYIINFIGAPGSPILFVGIVLFSWGTRFVIVGPWEILIMGLLTGLAEGLDAFGGIAGARLSGAGKWGLRGGVLGIILGSFLSLLLWNPLPFLIGPFVGVVVGEYAEKKEWRPAFRGAAGVILGKFGGVVLKQIICTAMVFYIFVAVLLHLF